MQIVILPSQQLGQSRYALFPADMDAPEERLLACLMDAWTANPAYGWPELAIRLRGAGFVVPDVVHHAGFDWDAARDVSQIPFFVSLPADAPHVWAGRRFMVTADHPESDGTVILYDDDTQEIIYAQDMPWSSVNPEQQVPLGAVCLNRAQFGQDPLKGDRLFKMAQAQLQAAGFSVLTTDAAAVAQS